ncbi:MAG TPA: hypothetical protein DFR83_04430 [Deltaproteobacteria bacterium]|nr:hypothetical protein [Deltaproteobacteria bacterium]
MKPTHEEIRQALVVLDDLELLAWTSAPHQYTLTHHEVDLPNAQGWVLSPIQVRTPVSVLLLQERDRRIHLATGSESVVATFLLPTVRGPESGLACAQAFVALWVEPSRGEQVVASSVALALNQRHAQLRFDSVAPRRGVRSWLVTLDRHTPSMSVAFS